MNHSKYMLGIIHFIPTSMNCFNWTDVTHVTMSKNDFHDVYQSYDCCGDPMCQLEINVSQLNIEPQQPYGCHSWPQILPSTISVSKSNAKKAFSKCCETSRECKIDLTFAMQSSFINAFCKRSFIKNVLSVTSTGSVLYKIDEAITGFQFLVLGATYQSVSGGIAEDRNLFVSGSPINNIIMGFALSPITTIPAGCGVLTKIESINKTSSLLLTDIVIASSTLTYVDVSYVTP